MENKKLLITGINGFIGNHCAKYFVENKWDVFGIDIFGENKPNIIIDKVSCNNLLKFKQKFDIIIHLAGTSSVALSQKNPHEEKEKTVQASQELIDYVKKYNKNAKIIYISSAAVYGNIYNGTIKEDDITKPISVYGLHKLEVENLIKSQKDLDFVIIRLFSVYGEGLQKQVLWDFCNKLKNNSKDLEIECFGTGNEERDFIHIDDVIKIIELAINLKKKNIILNGGNGISIKIKDIFEKLSFLMKHSGGLKYNNYISEYNPIKLVADNNRIKEFGYKQTVTLDEGLKKYVKWFKKI